MQTFLQELRYGARRLKLSPAFTVIVVMTLALGIGANTAIFSVVNEVLLKPLPYSDPDRLVTIEHHYPSIDLKASVSVRGFRDYSDSTKSFSSMAVQTGWGANLTGLGDPERIQGSRVTGRYFATLGAAAARGRTIVPGEDVEGREHVVVLSHALWQRLFAGDPAAIGRTIQLNGNSHEIIGVMAPGFRDFFNRQAELWVPLAFTPVQLSGGSYTNEWLALSARLAPGVTEEAARAEMKLFAEQLKRSFPDQFPPDWSLLTTSLNEKATGRIRPALLMLLGAVGFVLLIACANVANLLLARAAGRQKEVAIRTALGASRGDLVRQLLAESILLAGIGGAVGLVLAYAGVKALSASSLATLVAPDGVAIDGTVLAFTIALSLVTGLLFGMVPAAQISMSSFHENLKEGGRSATADRGSNTARRVLVVAEVALALMLLAGAGLLIKSFSRILGVSPGFEPANVLTLGISLPTARYPNDTVRVAFWDDALARIGAIPGVRGVAATTVMPFGGGWATGSFSVEGYEPKEGENQPWGDMRVASPGFLETMRIPLKRGRFFTEQDAEGAPQVVVVDDEMVRRYWPGADPIGKRIFFGGPRRPEPEYFTVVGVIGHVKQEGLDAEDRVQVYFPHRQAAPASMNVLVSTTVPPTSIVAQVRSAVLAIDKEQPISQVRTMEELLARSVGQRRLSMLLLGVFSGVALLLASIGIYGVMSYSVTQRGHEIGIRMALGAARPTVLRLVLRQGMTLVAIGLASGIAGALALTRLLESQLFGVRPTDPATFALVAAGLAMVALVATLVPALRATWVDPMVALRQE